MYFGKIRTNNRIIEEDEQKWICFCFLQGEIIVKHLRKEQVADHAVKIREQYDILEKYLTEHKFMATNYVKISESYA